MEEQKRLIRLDNDIRVQKQQADSMKIISEATEKAQQLRLANQLKQEQFQRGIPAEEMYAYTQQVFTELEAPVPLHRQAAVYNLLANEQEAVNNLRITRQRELQSLDYTINQHPNRDTIWENINEREMVRLLQLEDPSTIDGNYYDNAVRHIRSLL
jgi:hypothetical protein